MRSLPTLLLGLIAAAGAAIPAQDSPQKPPAAPVPPPTAAPVPVAAYPKHDLSKVIVLQKVGEKRTAAIDGKQLEALVVDLEAHARNYPPAFATKAEQELAQREAKDLGVVLEKLLAPVEGRPEPSPALLLLVARLEAAGHNVDAEGAAVRARNCFERLLRADPKHAAGHWHFGAFLGSTANGQQEAAAHLEKAVELGETAARFSLAVNHVMLGDLEKARQQLTLYLERYPDDAKARQLLQAVSEKGTKVERHVEGDPVAPPQPKGK